MATPTPLLKGLFTTAVVFSATALAWNLWNRTPTEPKAASSGTPVSTAPAAQPKKAPDGTTKSDPAKLLGSAQNPLKISIVSFHGYAPALVANGAKLDTAPDSIYAKQGLNAKFLIQDDIPQLATLFESGTAHCAWRTSDFWAQEQPNLRNAGLDGRAVMAVDNTKGADAIISANPDIRSVEDLPERKVGMLQFTPSHGMTIDAVDNSALTAKRKGSVKYVYINAEEGTPGVRAAFESGAVDAAVLWDPDLSLALRAVKGAHVVYSTKTASNLIYDIMVCDKRVLDSQQGKEAVQKFVAGWMEGIAVAKANPDVAVDALVATEELFSLLAKKEGKAFIKSLFGNLAWTDLEQNVRIFGLNGQVGHYNRVYKRFDEIYRAAGALANPKSPVIDPQDSVDLRFLQALVEKDKAAVAQAAKPEHTFTQESLAKATTKPAEVTKPVVVNFTSGSAELSKRAQSVIDKEMVPFIENNGSAYFEVSGNTDSVGGRDLNLRLSQARARAVVDYLIRQWEFPAARFKVVGNGPDKPLCNESNAAAEDLSLADCQAMNRSTRIAVFGK